MAHLFVGDAKRVWLPDIGRARVGAGHLRGLRHVHTVLTPSGLAADDLTDLARLRLDAVCTIEVLPSGSPGEVTWAHLLADRRGGAGHRVLRHPDLHRCDVDLLALLAALEAELGRLGDERRSSSLRERAVVVGVYPNREASIGRLAEVVELAATAGVEVVGDIVQLRRLVDSRFVVGRGKLEEATLRCVDLDASLLIFDHDLSPAQARAVASSTDLRVIDRTQLILDIFAQHAQSRDGALQVELAQLKYNLPRLTDLDAGLSRLTGGIGGRGPGETKLEINRRRARDRITKLQHQIDRLGAQRGLRRRRRQLGALPVVSIIGYTNAGKSTLMGRLTASEVKVADQLFATLDPTSRRLRFPREREAILTDTVGFIRELPPALLTAFTATLEELNSADLLLHVVDASDPRPQAQVEAVEAILARLELGTLPRLKVLNKVDCVPADEAAVLARRLGAVPISAQHGDGLDVLVDEVAQRLWQAEAPAKGDRWSGTARPAWTQGSA